MLICKAKNCTCEITSVQLQINYSVQPQTVYSGEIVHSLPHGQGKMMESENNWRTGLWMFGIFINGTSSNNSYLEKGTFNRHGVLIDGIRTDALFSSIEKGKFDKHGKISEGMRGKEGIFIETGKFKNNILIAGNRKTGNLIESGKFKNNILIAGNKKTGNLIETGKFKNGMLISGKKITSNLIENGKFENNMLIKGERDNGSLYENGIFKDNILTKGRKKDISFEENGIFINGKLVHGTSVLANGKVSIIMIGIPNIIVLPINAA